MARGGKREGAGRKPGSVVTDTKKQRRMREVAARALTTGMTPLEVMIENMRHFQQVARDAEATIEGFTAEEIAGRTLEPAEQFKVLLAEVKKAAGFRQMAQECARDASSFVHARIAPITGAGRTDEQVPLPDRLKEYQKRDTIEASGGKVVELKRSAG